MTFAPPNLLAVRELLLKHLPGLESAEAGIVGDAAHRGGYHCGRDRVDDDDYSVRESSRDRTGLTEAASALDIGTWSARVAGKTHDLRSMSVWLVAQCKAGTPDSRDIREIIYSPDGTTVKRWDRLGKRSTGDSSHRWHTHISYHRDSTKAGRDQTALYRRYLSEIGLVQAAREDDDMTPEQDSRLRFVDGRVEALTYGRETVRDGFPGAGDPVWVVKQLNALGVIMADLADRPAPGTVTITDDQLERVLRKVIGSVDNSTTA